MKNCKPILASQQQGFSFTELSVVLIFIVLTIGAVTTGAGGQSGSAHQKVVNNFLREWELAYLSHANKINVVPGDDQILPTGFINAVTNSRLCGRELLDAMSAAGVVVPPGRGKGRETHYGYLDPNGNPQNVEVCFEAITWSVPSATESSSYAPQTRNVMVVTGLTPDLAESVDGVIDGESDARFGKVRQLPLVVSTSSRQWNQDNHDAYEGLSTNSDEPRLAVLTAYYLMDR